MSISLDGFVAGPEQSRENPLGRGGMELHRWHLGDERSNEADETAAGWLMRPRGAYVMGRNMFGPIRGEWDEDWRGWWGPEPPYHAPVFVLTHHPHEPIELEGGTTFYFVTGGFDEAFAQARDVAGADGVDIAGGASTVRAWSRSRCCIRRSPRTSGTAGRAGRELGEAGACASTAWLKLRNASAVHVDADVAAVVTPD
jgi:dihydrofolate reductase